MALTVRATDGDDLGAELHDRVIGSLSALLLDMERFKRDQYNRASVQGAISSFQNSMRLALAELREVVNRAQGGPPGWLDEGLVGAIRKGPAAQLHGHTGAAVRISASPHFPDRLDAYAEMQIYRIVEQAIHNVAQHSGARNVRVEFRVKRGYYEIEVADDGRGKDWAEALNGQGTIGMSQRAALIGGELEISGQNGRGTVVKVRVPVRSWR